MNVLACVVLVVFAVILLVSWLLAVSVYRKMKREILDQRKRLRPEMKRHFFDPNKSIDTYIPPKKDKRP